MKRHRSLVERFILCGVIVGGLGMVALPVTCVAMYFAAADDPLPTLDGPEYVELAARLQGWLLVTDSSDEVEVIEFPARRSTRIHTARKRTKQLAGPDRSGRFVYVAESGSGYELRVTNVRGEFDELLVSGSGDPIWHTFDGQIALSPQGCLAFSAGTLDKSNRETNPKAQQLYLLELDTRTLRHTELDIERMTWTWHPDGHRLMLWRWLRLAADGSRSVNEPVTLFDIDTGVESDPIGLGQIGFCDSGGQRVWIGNWASPNWLLVDLDSGASETRSCPWMYPFAAAEGLVFAKANPTTGAKQRYLRTLQKGAQAMWTIKLFDSKSCEFVTVYDWVARFHRVSWGAR